MRTLKASEKENCFWAMTIENKMASTEDVDNKVDNILYDLSVLAEWKHENETFVSFYDIFSSGKTHSYLRPDKLFNL